MTLVTSLSALIDHGPDFRRLSGITDLAGGIHDANAHHARLVGHVQHHFVKTVAIVVEHVVRSAAAQNLAGDFNSTEQNLDSIQSSLNQSVTQNVTQINTLTQQIAQLNVQVGQMQKLGQDPGSLGDQETQLIQQLSQLTNVNQIQTENGLTLTTGNGTPLVVGGQSFALQTTSGPNGMTDISSQGQDITSSLQGGQLGGNLQIRDTAIPSMLSQLDNLASQFSASMNAAQASGYDLNGKAAYSSISSLFL